MILFALEQLVLKSCIPACKLHACDALIVTLRAACETNMQDSCILAKAHLKSSSTRDDKQHDDAIKHEEKVGTCACDIQHQHFVELETCMDRMYSQKCSHRASSAVLACLVCIPFSCARKFLRPTKVAWRSSMAGSSGNPCAGGTHQ